MTRDAIFEILAMEGFQPGIDEDGALVFVADGVKFIVDTDENDPDFVALTSLYALDSGMLDRRRAVAANITKTFKAGKCFVVIPDRGGPAVAFSIGMFTTIEVFRKMLRRNLGLLENMRADFFAELEQ